MGFWVWPHEPSYQGRSLNSWLLDFDSDRPERRIAAANAMNHIGPKAVPFLVNRLTSPYRKESRAARWKREALEWLIQKSIIKVPLDTRPDPRGRALAALDALGPAGKEGIPALLRLVREDPPDPRALYVISRMGPVGLPVLRMALTNENRHVRLQAAVCMEMTYSQTGLPPSSGASEPDAGTFQRRICEFNLRMLKAALRQYATQHPDLALPKNIEDTPPSSPLPTEYRPATETSSTANKTNSPIGRPALN